MRKENRLVLLLDPKMCETCRFAGRAMITNAAGKEEELIHCERGDCDNWQRAQGDPKVENFRPIS